jgi:hypothetical protein
MLLGMSANVLAWEQITGQATMEVGLKYQKPLLFVGERDISPAD